MHILRIFWREIMKSCVRSSYVQKLHELKPMAFSFRGLYPSSLVRNLLAKSINYKPTTVSRESSTNALATRRAGTEKTWTTQPQSATIRQAKRSVCATRGCALDSHSSTPHIHNDIEKTRKFDAVPGVLRKKHHRARGLVSYLACSIPRELECYQTRATRRYVSST